MVSTLMSLFPLISCCRLGSEPTPPSGTEGNCSSACRDFRRFTERFSCRGGLAGGGGGGGGCRGKAGAWPMHMPRDAKEKLGEGGGRRLA